MSKKTFLTDDFMETLDEVVPAKKGKGDGRFSDPMDGASSNAVSKVSGKNTDPRGRVRKTIFLPPELIWEIDNTSKRDGYASKMDFYHWLVTVGWAAYQDGKRPPTGNVTTSKDIKLD